MDSSLKSKTISSLFWKLFEKGGYAVVEMVIQVVMARLLTANEYGALSIMLVFVNLGSVVVQSGLNTALVQAPDASDEDCSTVFWMSLAISLGLYAVIFLAAPAIASYYAMPEITWPLRALCLILVVTAYNAVQVAVVQRALEFRKVFHATIASTLASAVLGIGSAFAGVGLWALVVQQLTYYVVNCLALAVQVTWRPRLVFQPARALVLFRFSWKLLVSSLLDQGYQSLSDLIIGKQFSSLQLGYVSQGKKYPRALGNMLDGAIQPVMLSAVSRVQDDKARVKRLVRRALKTSTFLIAPCMALFAVVAEPLVRILLGEAWLSCVPFLRMYCFVYALQPIHTSNLQALNGMGRSDYFLKLEIIKKCYGVVFLCIAAFVFKDVYVMVGTYMITTVISTVVNSWPNRHVIGYTYGEQIRDIAPAFALTAVSAVPTLALGLLGLSNLMTILLQAVVMAVCYLGLAKLTNMETLEYLLATGRELLAGKVGARKA